VRRRRRTPLDDAFWSGVLTLFSMSVLLAVLFVGGRG
jgi:hypothetical protein